MSSANAIAPAILRLQPEADDRQLELIGHLEGPVLGIAGPGAGKTLAIVRRSANLLLLGAVQPEKPAVVHLQPGRRPGVAPAFRRHGLGRRL